MPSFSTKHLKFLFFDNEPATANESGEVPDSSIYQGVKAMKYAFERAAAFKKSTKMIVFVCGDFFLGREGLNEFVRAGIENGGKLLESMEDLLLFQTIEKRMITVRFVGGSHQCGGLEKIMEEEVDTDESSDYLVCKTGKRPAPGTEPSARMVKLKVKACTKKSPVKKTPVKAPKKDDSDDSDFDDWANKDLTQELRYTAK